MKANLISFLFSALLATAAVASDENSAQQEFEQRYSALKQAIDSNQPDTIMLPLLQQAYEASARYWGSDAITTADLQFSYLNLLPSYDLQNATSLALAETVLASYEKHYGSSDPELIPALLLVLRSYDLSNKMAPAIATYEQLLDIASQHSDKQPEQMLQAKIEAGAQLLRLGSKRSQDLLEFSAISQQQFGADHDLTLLAEFHVARYLEAKGQDDQAAERFALVASRPAQDIPEYLFSAKYISHARMVNRFAAAGNDAEASLHCLAVAEMGYGIGDEGDPVPLYRVHPIYPQAFAGRRGRGGSVTVQYDINAVGQVENVRIVESSYKAFAKVTEDAVKQWRFAPRMVNGEAVTSKDRLTQLNFVPPN